MGLHNMNEEITPSKINIVTEHKENYKLVSLFLMDSYNGLHPSSLSKLAHVIFNLIIYNKLYRKPDNKYYSLEEDRRIYSNILITPDSILERIAPSKYRIDKKDMSNDISNLTARIQDLEDNNVFYVWKYRQPFTYLFVLERDVGCWKYYNSSAFVTPKTLKKVVRAGKCIIDTMVKLEGKRERSVDQKDIENSFGNFISKLISKMNPSVASELSKWVNEANIHNYLSRLSTELRSMEDYKGQVIASDFLNRLPNPVRNEIVNKKNTKETKDKTNKVAKGDNMNLSMELELIPKDENLVKIRRTRKTKVSNPNESIPTTATKFSAVNPFSNATDFIKYYRSVIRSQNPEAKFCNALSETSDAEMVLDLLTKNNRLEDVKFLKMWIYNYHSTSLSGNNIHKTEKTALKEFMRTFSSFNGNYYG